MGATSHFLIFAQFWAIFHCNNWINEKYRIIWVYPISGSLTSEINANFSHPLHAESSYQMVQSWCFWVTMKILRNWEVKGNNLWVIYDCTLCTTGSMWWLKGPTCFFFVSGVLCCISLREPTTHSQCFKAYAKYITVINYMAACKVYNIYFNSILFSFFL